MLDMGIHPRHSINLKFKIMVKIIDFVKRQNKDGEEFNALIIQGGLEMVKSNQTGRYYATAKKASVTSTLDDLTCKELIGEKIPGSVQKVECEPYEFTLKETGEVVTLNHRWMYLKEGETMEEKIIADSKVAMPL
jgi:hypothetical protein